MKSHLLNCVAAIACSSLTGCESDLPLPPPDDAPTITVMFESDPVADIEVKLHESGNGPAIVRSVTSTDGKARFVDVPDPEPAEYFVSLESASDGGWILDQDVTQRLTRKLRLKPLNQESSQTIELPSRSIKPLYLEQ